MLTDDDQLTCFIKDIERIVGRVKGEVSPYVQGHQYYEEELFVRERVPNRTAIPPARVPGTSGNHSPIVQAHNNSSSDNKQ